MRVSLKVFLPDGKHIGVEESSAGDVILYDLLQLYGNLKVEAYEWNDLFGVGYDGAIPFNTMTLKECLAD